MTKIAEYSEVNDTNRSKAILLSDAYSQKVHATVCLRKVSAGYEPAGSMARWTDGYYSVRWMSLGAFQGQRYNLTEDGLAKANSHFQRLTA